MVVSHTRKAVFVHIPKTGGSSVRARLMEPGCHDPHAVAGDTKHETAAEFQAAYSLRTRRDPAELDHYAFFAIVRNPWDRLLSLHRYLLAQHADSYPETPTSFIEFCRVVVERPAWADPIRALRPQADFVRGRDVTVARFEKLADAYAPIAKRFGIDAALPHLNRTATTPVDYRSEYDDATAELIATAYAEDATTFGYRFESPSPASTAARWPRGDGSRP